MSLQLKYIIDIILFPDYFKEIENKTTFRKLEKSVKFSVKCDADIKFIKECICKSNSAFYISLRIYYSIYIIHSKNSRFSFG